MPLLEFGDPEAQRTLERLLRVAAPGTLEEEVAYGLMVGEVAAALDETLGGEEVSRELAARIGWTIFLGAVGFGHAAASYCREAGVADFAGGLGVFERLVEQFLAGTTDTGGEG
jgi:hypothetical protein